jgi:hypothetical protein
MDMLDYLQIPPPGIFNLEIRWQEGHVKTLKNIPEQRDAYRTIQRKLNEMSKKMCLIPLKICLNNKKKSNFDP